MAGGVMYQQSTSGKPKAVTSEVVKVGESDEEKQKMLELQIVGCQKGAEDEEVQGKPYLVFYLQTGIVNSRATFFGNWGDFRWWTPSPSPHRTILGRDYDEAAEAEAWWEAFNCERRDKSKHVAQDFLQQVEKNQVAQNFLQQAFNRERSEKSKQVAQDFLQP
ncbi:GDP-mannose transporter [Striga asiatica]|uniref:GDP-mannose transporter n=1 Tax=Striga asiatica TaxID=4170 RepID=A0A5A7P9P6_STRAF|nr:GDP-mannose transporter [Striga asiatica]